MTDQSTPSPTGPSPSEKRQSLLLRLGLGVAVLAIAWALYYFLYAAHFIETDNAYVGAETAQVNALAPGPVARIDVAETQSVRKGDALVELDDAEARIAVVQAQANLDLTKRKVKSYFANGTALDGQVAARAAQISASEAQLASARSDYDRARSEYERRQPLVDIGAVSQDELITVKNTMDRASAALTAAQAQAAEAKAGLTAAKGTFDTNQTLISGADIDHNPEVMAAQARLDNAQLMLDRTTVRAPVDGVVARKSAQVGQQVGVGTPLMSIVPIDKAYVDANFKEVQLRKVHPDQQVDLTSDYYGKGVVFHGKVVGLSGGTGSAFSLIPAQNATGNWIKVVQRLSVRVALDPKELKAHPLRVGLSMTARINTNP